MKGITTIQGHNPGKTIAIIAGIHGNEDGGVTALQNALATIPIENGTVHYILGNPKAIKQSLRFTEMNLNRAFIRSPLANSFQEETYERKRALEIIPILETCDALLDIHSVANIEATPFIICEEEYFPLARNFPFPIVSSGWNTIQPGSTDYYMSTAGKPALCLECGYHKDPSVPERALEGIRVFLGIMGNISNNHVQKNNKQQKVRATDVYISKNSFQLARSFRDFEEVPQGELIGKDQKYEYRAPYSGIIIFARNTNIPGQDAVIFGKII